MRLIPTVAAVFALSVSGPSFAQEWTQYTSREDFFSINFPGEPEVRDIAYPTEYGTTLPGRIHSVADGPYRYSVTAVDYTHVRAIHAERLKGCQSPDPDVCDNPWVNELRGALDYAAWSFIQRNAKVTHYAYYAAERVEGRRIQLTNADQSRTFAAIHMHENRLYIIEGTVPPGAPPPGLFQQSIGFIDKDGTRIRYEATYANMYPPPLRVQYAPPGTPVPDLSGMQMGTTRRFTEGPFAGQTWGVDGSGQPYRVREGAPSTSQGFP